MDGCCSFLLARLLHCGDKTKAEWLGEVRGGGLLSHHFSSCSHCFYLKTRTKNADLCYQAVEIETAATVLLARGEVGCVPMCREQSRITTLHYQPTPVNICKRPFKARKPRTGSLDDLLRRRRNKIDLMIRDSHKKKACEWAEDQKGGKKWLKV